MAGPQLFTTLIDRRAQLTGEVKKLREARPGVGQPDPHRRHDPHLRPDLRFGTDRGEGDAGTLGWPEKGEMPRLVLDTLRDLPDVPVD
jgi:hypothetical protein